MSVLKGVIIGPEPALTTDLLTNSQYNLQSPERVEQSQQFLDRGCQTYLPETLLPLDSCLDRRLIISTLGRVRMSSRCSTWLLDSCCWLWGSVTGGDYIIGRYDADYILRLLPQPCVLDTGREVIRDDSENLTAHFYWNHYVRKIWMRRFICTI